MMRRRTMRRTSRAGFGGSRRTIRAAPTRVVRSAFVSRSAAFRMYPSTGGGQVESTPGPLAQGSAVLLNSIVRGNSINERTSNRVRMLDLTIRGGIAWNPYAPNGNCQNTQDPNTAWWTKQQDFSLIIAYIPVSVAALPQLTSYYQQTPGSSVVDTWSLPLTTQYPTMRILYRKDYNFKVIPVSTTAAAAATQIVPSGAFPANAGWTVTCAPMGVRQVKIRLRVPYQVVFTDTAIAPSFGGIASGCLCMYMLGDYVTGSGSPPTVDQRPLLTFECRLNFVDLD